MLDKNIKNEWEACKNRPGYEVKVTKRGEVVVKTYRRIETPEEHVRREKAQKDFMKNAFESLKKRGEVKQANGSKNDPFDNWQGPKIY